MTGKARFQPKVTLNNTGSRPEPQGKGVMAFEAKRKFQQSADISSLSKENGLQVDEDYLRQAEVLSSEEVVRRRLLKTRQ